MQAHQRGDWYEADLLYARALEQDPEQLQALRLRGALARDRGDAGAALRFLERAAELAPDNPLVAHELGLTYMALGQLPEAEARLGEALQLQPDSAAAHLNLGAVLHQRGHVRAAIGHYERVVEATPDDLYARCNLAKALSDAGEFETALAATAASNAPMVIATAGAVLLDKQDYPAARSTLEPLATAETIDDMTLVNLGVACYELADIAAATAYLQQALRFNPDNARAAADLANCLTADGNAAAATQLCSEFLSRHPGERLVIASQALALQAQGEQQAALALIDARELVQVFDIEATDSLVSVDELNTLLTKLVREDPSLLSDPVSKSTMGGAQTGELDFSAHPALAGFYELLCGAVTEATQRYSDMGLDQHPLMAGADGAQTVRAWGTQLKSGGRQSSHMHPLAWLSGVYYTHVPVDMDTAGTRAGWLEFNRPPERFYTAGDPQTWCYEPKPGRLVLFPSWFWHQTLPFESTDDRISIAFDIVPLDALRML